MNHLAEIQEKLKKFISKYYINELVKGVIFFFTLGLLYFIVTLAIEHFLWLSSDGRTVLFWLFIIAEAGLLYYYLLIPLTKLNGLKKGISEIRASQIIGAHFPEVSDKLLNLLQLKNSKENSELIEASIAQKSLELKPFTFKKAIDLKANKKYLKFALVPVLLLLIFELSNKGSFISESYDRIVHYTNTYEPPAPFTFVVKNNNLNVLEGEETRLLVEVIGDVLPEEARIHINDESYYLNYLGNNEFEYIFQSVNASFDFYLSAVNVESSIFHINCIPTPVVTNLKMVIKYPPYTGKNAEVIQNTGNATVPQGSEVSWQIETNQVEELKLFFGEKDSLNFVKNGNDYFSLTKELMNSLDYYISTSNDFLENHENLPFSIGVIPDSHPKIAVESNMDSLKFGPVEFIGELSDDYGIGSLQMVYYDLNNKEAKKRLDLPIERSNFTDFYYIFPDRVEIKEGAQYELYFEVFDNDAVNGRKRSKSRIFGYYQPSTEELTEALLEEQKETIEDISDVLEDYENADDEIGQFEQEIQKKGAINWNDEQKLADFLKRQEQYEEMFKKQTNQLEENLNTIPTDESDINKKEELQKRINEAKELAERNKILDELDSLSNKLAKEDMLDKLEEMSRKNAQNKQSLARLLEMTKRFYVEQKMAKIATNLSELSKQEDDVSEAESKSIDSLSMMQEKIEKEFEDLEKELDELDKQNEGLRRPMDTPDHEEAVEDIKEDLNKAMEELNKNSKEGAKKPQKEAARKMKKLSEEFEQQMMQMEGEQLNENIDDLRKIVENLIEYSFMQEALLDRFKGADNKHPDFPTNLKKQQVLKEYFEHIDDSLYVLSLRVASMSMQIQKEVNDVHYHMDNSLQNFAENRFNQGLSNQQFMITGANNLANMLSNLLENLMNASMSMGKGSGEQEFKLPDIIQKQGELSEQLQENSNEDGKEGEEGETKEGDGQTNEGMNGELFEIYKQQVQLREALEQMLGGELETGNKGSGDVIKEMEMLEQELIDKGLSLDAINRMEKIKHELLKLQTAKKEQGEDKQRESREGQQSGIHRAIEALKAKNRFTKEREKLNRQSLPLRSIYKEKVESYFKNKKAQRDDSVQL